MATFMYFSNGERSEYLPAMAVTCMAGIAPHSISYYGCPANEDPHLPPVLTVWKALLDVPAIHVRYYK